jgi:hypothetical protein
MTDIPLADGPDSLEPTHPPYESKATKVVVGLLGAALLFGPWVAYAGGARSDQVPGENRTLAPRPTIDGFDTFPQVTQYAADHFPLRDAAIRGNKKLIEKLFGEDPSYFGSATTLQVLQGEQGWLYLYDDFNEACAPKVALKDVLAGVSRLDRMLADSGRRLVVTMPPDKSTVDTQFLPKSFALKECTDTARAARWKAIRALDLPGWVDMRKHVEDQEKRLGKPGFLPYDTHWNQDSQALFATEMARQLDPALLQGTKVAPGPEYVEHGDLETLQGTVKDHRFHAVFVQRDGVTTTRTDDELGPVKGAYTVSRFAGKAAGTATLFDPKTVWIGDSFTQRSLDSGTIQYFFRDMTRVPELTKAVLASGGKPEVYQQARARMIQEIVDAKVTVLELVERTFMGAGGYGSMWDPKTHFLDDLQKALDAAK